MPRPHVLIKTAMSLDGCIDDLSEHRLMISNAPDFRTGDVLRKRCDALMIGAQSIRLDNPSLTVKDANLAAERQQEKGCEHPIKVTVTSTGALSPGLKFFHTGTAKKLVYCPTSIRDDLAATLGDLATVVACDGVDGKTNLALVLEDLHARGVDFLMVEGGGVINAQLIGLGLVDEMRISVAPFFVGDDNAPRLITPAALPEVKGRRMRLSRVEQLEQVAVLHFVADRNEARA